jgi:LysM repeat protein
MVAQQPARRWISRRIRVLCAIAFVAGSLFPPYIPPDALAGTQVDDGLSADEGPQILLVEDGFLMKSSSLTQQGTRRAYAEGLIHVVREGEKLTELATRFGIKRETIEWVNKLPANTPLKPGQELIILPVDGVLHTVSRGQTISRIAELYSVPPAQIRDQNKLDGDFILAGQELIIPGGKPIVEKPVVVAQDPKPTPGTKPTPAKPSPGKTPEVKATPSYGVLQMPCNNCFYTQLYHPGHYAVDIQTKGGGPIFASEDGKVIRSDGRHAGEGGGDQWNGGYGNVIEVDHGNGLITLYAHNKELYVKDGDTVKRGQVIAWMGNTGRVYGATGIHTHYEVRVNGVKKNPVLYLK